MVWQGMMTMGMNQNNSGMKLIKADTQERNQPASWEPTIKPLLTPYCLARGWSVSNSG